MSETAPHYQFRLDFATLGPIPEDPKVRLDYYRAFQRFLGAERDKIRIWHRQGAGGREVVQAHTGLVDETIKHVVMSLHALPDFGKQDLLNKFALVAIGGYGRGELNPCSDIDLLFLYQGKMSKALDRFIQEIISVLWGIGLEIGQSCRTLRDCQSLAKDDPTIRTSMIETRFLIGLNDLHRKLGESIRKSVLGRSVTKFLEDNIQKFFTRKESEAGVTSHPEPDNKNGPGGLREYHAAMWTVAVCFGGLSLRELDRDDIIGRDELDSLYPSVNFLLRVRNELHYLAGNKSDQLSLSFQKDLASNLGYKGAGTTDLVEQFMKDFYQHATIIHTVTDAVFHRCMDNKPMITKMLKRLQQKKLAEGFVEHKGQLRLENPDGSIFQNNREALLTAFTLCRDHDLEPGPQLRRQIGLHAHLLDSTFRQSQEAKDFFLNLLNHPRSAKVLRLMHEEGILVPFLPEFAETQFQMRYDFYHRFTSDEHALRMVRFLEEFETLETVSRKKLKEVYHSTRERVVLKLSCLLHSLEGQQEMDHERMTQTLKGVIQRFGLKPRQGGLLHFLIKHKNVMNEMAFHHDIHQPATLNALAEVVDHPEKLDMLYLFSYAELKAVAPDTWTQWKNLLLTELYDLTHTFLLRPETLEEKPKEARSVVFSLLSKEFSHEEISRHLDSLPTDYFASVDSEVIAEHIRMIHQMDEGTFVLKHAFNASGGFFELVLCGPTDIQMFKNLVGTLTAKAMNILGAQIYRRTDGVAILTLQVEGSKTMEIHGDSDSVWQEIQNNFQAVLEKTKTLQELLKGRTRFHSGSKKVEAIEPKIQISNQQDQTFTSIRIEARDHAGMLYKIVNAFAKFGIQIHSAKIGSQGGRGIDTFSVSLRGGKIQFDKLLDRIKDQIIQNLLVDKLEDLQ